MIEKLISFSVKNRFLVLMATLFLILGSVWAMKNTPLDALPDLSPPQVIVQVTWKGQSPEIIEDQGTYPLVSQFLAISNIETVRGFSTYENALIYIIFKEGTDLYWGRSRVLEQLASIQSKLPANMEIALGPDASGVGWVYEYALTSKTKTLDELRTLQDYYYKYALMGVDGVSEVASIGGFVPTYQITVNNDALVQYNLSVKDITRTLKENNNDTGGRIVIQNGFEWMVQAKGYIKDLDEIQKLVITTKDGVPLTLGDVGRVEMVPAARRGMADLNGEGEVVSGIVMVRYGEDVYSAINRIKTKMKELEVEDVDVVTTYDRSELIEASVETLQNTLLEESIIVVIIIGLFLMHFRSMIIMLIVLPLTIALPFLMMKLFGIGSNIMSLGGIAIAIGAMVDASIVMIENAHKSIHKEETKKGAKLDNAERIAIIVKSSQLVGRPIFFALALVVVSFLPIFALNGQEGLLFSPLAFTKTFAMTAGALLSVTLVPVLMVFFVRGHIIPESKNPLNRFFIWLYHPILIYGLKLKYVVIALAIGLLAFSEPLYEKLNWEFMPMLDEQTMMYMPVTPYGISVDQSKALTQKTDAIIKSFPEVRTVFGKGGRADSATDPAPLGMLETIITFKPKDQWRPGMTREKLLAEMEKALQIPGLVNSWTYPIRGRIDMLLTGIRTPIGIKLFGKDSGGLQSVALEIERKLRDMKSTQSVFSDQASAGFFIDINIDVEALQRYNISKSLIEEYTSAAIGGKKITTMYKGLERYPIALRFEEEERRNLDAIRNIQVKTALGFVPLSTFAKVEYRESASVIKSEMATPVTFVYITPKQGMSVVTYKEEAMKVLADLKLPAGYYFEWAGQSEYLESAMKKMKWIIPTVFLVILVLIYFALKTMVPTLIVFFTLPFALIGGLIYIQMLNFNMSIAVIVGFLALLGIAAETAIVMIVYLQESVDEMRQKVGDAFNFKDLDAAIYEGAVQRVRPKLMTVFAILAGLLPIMMTSGVGSEVMKRIAAPMIGGVVTSAVLSLLLIPIFFEMYEKHKLKKILKDTK
ncbi:MAG: CusA/CzcA family heavy metal efflux RND transporter [Sulfurovum sp. 24-42-9]|jgi:Cu(I)/Ag(I) efflux system membrane protein CusA/SilA|nr:MAG: CusA/CzcA family heavy metal efflux RND transporter [Sulfurovum sp. 35-42-20]OYZ47888.1 MAG: CusA/CzcA family heavy metal efflux RND transporter [Sulfurovum sp. 24-42-9]OZA43423.1 MAG: CusA/CzcA family heavy metal efflux RND transporter [Sulfurovum sp. 17-42-90]HQS78563.1 CusA/CzcA family heavy metal efflux RND transporter [Sulfurovum sp.]